MNEAFKLAPQEWALLRGLLDEALALPRGVRERWLQALPEDRAAGLKPRLRALLANADGEEPDTAMRLLETFPRVETGQFATPPGAGEKPGDIVGPYRLLRELGSGGMGSVWLAEHTDLLQGRQVALKLPHGAWRRAGLAERLARERAILATLEHRNIARLYDAGVTPEGQPWLALEYVDGERIDVHCRAKALAVRERLQLFLQVARAVAHAHGQLVVHRDLKPANILVTQVGDVKLLDFGIAKLVAEGVVEETELTREVGRAFTPEYASPEQILGRPLGTASDVYSLGVVLFELLADVRPYRLSRTSRAALEEAVAEAAVPRPSTLAPPERRRALRGDLDTIVLKALKREPVERYATVAALADDVQRYLEQRTVLAQPDSAWYRLSMYVRRHRVGVAATAAVALALLAGGGVSLWQAREARVERDMARLQERRAEYFSDFMRVLLQDVGRNDVALTPSKLLDRGVAMLERRASLDPSLAAHLWFELSRSYLLFNDAGRELDLLARSVKAAREAGDFNQLAMSECSSARTEVVRDMGRAQAHQDAGTGALERASNRGDEASVLCVRSEARLRLARGQAAEALALVEAERERLGRRGRGALWADVMRPMAVTLYMSTDRAPEAWSLVEGLRRELRAAGREGSLVELMATSDEASLLARMGEYRRSAEVAAPLAEWARRPELAGRPPTGVAINAAAARLRLGRYDEALQLARFDLPAALSSGNVMAAVTAHLAEARAFAGLGRLAEARAALDRIEALGVGRNPALARLQQEVTMDRAHLLLLEGRVAEARSVLDAVLRGVGYPASLLAPGIDRLLRLAARIELADGQAARADTLAQHAAQAARRQARGEDTSGDVGLARALRAQALAAMGLAGEASLELQAGMPALLNGLGPDHEEVRQAQALLRKLGGASAGQAAPASSGAAAR